MGLWCTIEYAPCFFCGIILGGNLRTIRYLGRVELTWMNRERTENKQNSEGDIFCLYQESTNHMLFFMQCKVVSFTFSSFLPSFTVPCVIPSIRPKFISELITFFFIYFHSLQFKHNKFKWLK